MINISIHDITKSSLENIKILKSILNEYGINKISYLLIPFYHEKESIIDIKDEVLELIQNNEVILHGYTHLSKAFKLWDYRKIFTYYEGEFLSEDSLKDRIKKGLDILDKIDIKPRGFIAPAWMFKKELISILKDMGFSFTTDRRYIYNLEEDKKVFAPVISFGSRGFVEDVSIFSFDKSFLAFKSLNTRIALHPIDATSSKKIEKLKKVLDRIKAKDVYDLYHIVKAKN